MFNILYLSKKMLYLKKILNNILIYNFSSVDKLTYIESNSNFTKSFIFDCKSWSISTITSGLLREEYSA